MKLKFFLRGRLDSLFTRQEQLALGFVLAVGFFGLLLGASESRRLKEFLPPERAVRLSVRVNSALAEELAALPGIGPVLAGRIVKERQIRGAFLTLRDLARVKGMSSKVLSRIEGLVRFD